MADDRIEALQQRLHREAEASGYHLNPDAGFVRMLAESLLTNEDRYGYPACPCRLASGNKGEDLDIVCPCDYRDPDLTEYGACYCALYVSVEIARGEKTAESIPDRRPPEGERQFSGVTEREMRAGISSELQYAVWRCKVCGYLCARDDPPEVCPVCKAKKDRFERFM